VKLCDGEIETLKDSLKALLVGALAIPSHTTSIHVSRYVQKTDLLTFFYYVAGYTFSRRMSLNKLLNLITIPEKCKKHFHAFCMVSLVDNYSIILRSLDCDLIPES
jgi:hypothetical protein